MTHDVHDHSSHDHMTTPLHDDIQIAGRSVWHAPTRSVLDFTPDAFSDEVFTVHIEMRKRGEVTLINRINVPEEHRGQGLGNALLHTMIAHADANEIPLALIPISSSHGSLRGPGQRELEKWYRRNGFSPYKKGTALWLRKPGESGQRKPSGFFPRF